LLKKRVVLLPGKGGVGRSSLTAAIGMIAQRRGVRVLVTEIGDDPKDYSPLARVFGLERLPAAPAKLAPGIDGALLLARTGQELFLRSVLRSSTLARAAIGSESLRRLLSAGPSFKEMGVFFQLLTYLRMERAEGEPLYQLILVDMPATGHTLSLTGLPDMLLRLLPRGPIAEALREGQSYLNDPQKSAAYVVTLPETLPVSECLELLEGLKKTAMPTGGVILNRFPNDPFTRNERELLHPLIEKHNLFGAEGFHKPESSRRELARLRAGTKLPIFVIPELPQAGLIPKIADSLLAAEDVTAVKQERATG
jgi:arsenite/tail-anchored protein-transporting ATPase